MDFVVVVAVVGTVGVTMLYETRQKYLPLPPPHHLAPALSPINISTPSLSTFFLSIIISINFISLPSLHCHFLFICICLVSSSLPLITYPVTKECVYFILFQLPSHHYYHHHNYHSTAALHVGDGLVHSTTANKS